MGVTQFPAHPGHLAKGKVPCSRPLSVDVKYLGMNVHKEAIVIEVMNEAGKVWWSPSSKRRDGCCSPDALLNCRTWRPTHGSGIVTLMRYHKVWRKQCQATRTIRRRFGLKNALDYLVSEKLLHFAEAAEQHPEFAAERPLFRPPGGRSFTQMSLPVTWLLSGP